MTYDKRLSICQQRKKLYDKYFRGRTAKSQTYNRSLITMDILDIYQDEYGVFFAKYFNSSVEKIEIEGIDAREILYDLKDLRQSAEAERKAKESLHREAIIQGKEPLDIVFRSEGDWKGYVARGVSGKVMYAFNCADLHPKYGT